ncbi:hypothetical protein [Paenibacillus sp. IHBB 3054]
MEQFIESLEDDEYKLDMLDLMEEALMKIADGQGDPVEIATAALKTFKGE